MFRLSRQFGRNPEKVAIMNLANVEKKIAKLGKLVFFNSMSDTFHESIPDEVIEDWMDMFERHSDHQFQVLTKRINRARNYVKEWGKLPKNVWLGTSVEDRAHTFRIKTLQSIPHNGIKFISFEPLLGDVGKLDLHGIHWAIVGGESGLKSENPRYMNPHWAEDIMLQCADQGVAFFFKQHGGIGGDGAGGNLLNGYVYHEMPAYEE
jgi:protein gp37